MPTIMRDVIPKFDSDKSLSSIEKKQVRFSKISKVVLIPSRLEYYAADLNDKLWFTPKDFHDCLSSAQLEVEEYMSRGGLTGSLTRQQMKDAFLNPIDCQPPHSIEAMPIDIMERGGVLLDRSIS